MTIKSQVHKAQFKHVFHTIMQQECVLSGISQLLKPTLAQTKMRRPGTLHDKTHAMP